MTNRGESIVSLILENAGKCACGQPAETTRFSMGKDRSVCQSCAKKLDNGETY